MLVNYVKIAYRTLRRQPVITAINILGLALGLAACLLIGLFVKHELSYDNFHPKADRTYRIVTNIKLGGLRTEAPLSPPPMAEMLAREFPEVQRSTRVHVKKNATVRVDDRVFREVQLLSADSSFFKVLSGFTLQQGTPGTPLSGVNSAVLTNSAAEKYFETDDPIGERFEVGDELYRVAGIMDDVPPNSHLQFSLALSQDLPPEAQTQWAGNDFYTYFRLKEGISGAHFGKKLDQLVRNRIIPRVGDAHGIPLGEMLKGESSYRYDLQCLSDIYLESDSRYEAGPTGSLATVYIFAAIAALVLLIACANFVNLATARAEERATEVGIRKAVGASRPQLARQFLGEAIITTAGAFVLALIAVHIVRPIFSEFSGVPLSLSDLLTGPYFLAITAFILLTGTLAGSYPAFILSSFDPSEVLPASGHYSSGGRTSWIRQGLVVGQFAISVALVTGTLGIWKQYDYIQTKQIGFDEERVVAINQAQALGSRLDAFLKQAKRQRGVLMTSYGDPVFSPTTRQGYASPEAPAGASKIMSEMDVGRGFVKTLGVRMVSGRSFDSSRVADSTAVVLNEAAVDALGWNPREAVGRTIQRDGNTDPLQVIGVSENFHYQSLQQRIQPLVLRLGDTEGQKLYARLDGERIQSALGNLQAVWQEVSPDPFQHTFLDLSFDRLHRSTQRTGRLLSIFAALAVAVAGLGMFGLATYNVQRRRKQIGIRKAMGATVLQIVVHVSKEFVQLVGLAIAIGIPVAYLAMHRWLQNFAYRTSLGLGILLGSVGLAVGVAAVAISYHTVQAARTDPAATLRDE